jgi:peptide/nickel transport system substrate-binding protein
LQRGARLRRKKDKEGRKMKKTIVMLVSGLVVVTLVLAFDCAPVMSQPRSAPTGKVVIGLEGDPPRMDPQKALSGADTQVHVNMFDGLYNWNWDGSLVPGLATSYKVSADSLTYTFELRKGVKFHNGDPFTAEDVKFSIERYLDAKTGAIMRSHVAAIANVQVVNPYVVTIRLNKPDPALINKLAFVSIGAIVPKKYIEAIGGDGYAKNPVGTGPFKFVSHSRGDKLVMEAFEDFWGEKPHVETVEWRIMPEAVTRVAALKAGELDIAMLIPPHLSKDIKATPGLRLLSIPSGMFYYLVLTQIGPTANRWFQDVRVRKALNYAINKEAIKNSLYDGRVMLCNSFDAPSLPSHNPTIPGYPYDPDKARKLLQEANFDFNQKFTVTVPKGMYLQVEEYIQAIAADWAKLGIQTQVEYVDHNYFYAKTIHPENSPDIWPNRMTNRYNDPMYSLLLAVRSGGFISRCSSPELDKMIDAMNLVSQREERIKRFQEIYRKISDDAIYVFQWEPYFDYGLSNRVNWDMGEGQMPMPIRHISIK